MPRTSLQCVCTRRRNCIEQLSPSRKYAPRTFYFPPGTAQIYNADRTRSATGSALPRTRDGWDGNKKGRSTSACPPPSAPVRCHPPRVKIKSISDSKSLQSRRLTLSRHTSHQKRPVQAASPLPTLGSLLALRTEAQVGRASCVFYCTATASGCPFSAIMQLRILAVSDELVFFALCTCLAGLKVISPAFNSKGCACSGSNKSDPCSM